MSNISIAQELHVLVGIVLDCAASRSKMRKGSLRQLMKQVYFLSLCFQNAE